MYDHRDDSEQVTGIPRQRQASEDGGHGIPQQRNRRAE